MALSLSFVNAMAKPTGRVVVEKPNVRCKRQTTDCSGMHLDGMDLASLKRVSEIFAC